MSTEHSKRAAKFTQNVEKTTWHDNTFWSVRQKRDHMAQQLPEWEDLREHASEIKKHTITHLADYLDMFSQNLESRGVKVHWAKDAQEFNEIDHAGANLVGVAGAQEVDSSDDRQQGDEAEVHQLMHGYHGIVEQRVEIDEAGKMSDEVVDVVGIDKESGSKPVGGDDSQDGGCKVAETEGVGEEHHHRPQYGQIIENLYKLHRGYA